MDQNKTILLVEDEALIAILESKTVSRAGYRVVTASGGREAIEIVRSSPDISLVLMDINLGTGMDGTEAAVEILKIRELPVVFLTSHSEEEMVDRVKGITRYGYVLKNSGEFVLIESINMAYELFEARDKYRDLAEKSHTLICEVDEKVNFLYVNSAFKDILGYEPEELIGRSAFEIGHPAMHERGYERLEASMNGEKKQVNEWQFVDKQGNWHWLESISNAYTDAGGNFRMNVVSFDITERKKNEELLLEKQAFVDKLFESIKDGITIISPDGSRMMINKAFADMTGYSRKELVNCYPPFSIWPPEHAGAIAGVYEKMKDGLLEETELVFMRKDGERFPVLLTPSTMRDKNGYVVCYITVIKDLTEYKKKETKTEAILRQSQEKYRDLAEKSNALICEIDMDGKFLFVTPAYKKILGYDPEDLIGHTAYEIGQPAQIEKARDKLKSCVEEKQQANEWQFIDKNGQWHWLECVSNTYEDSEGKTRVNVVSFDITERKNAENRIKNLFEERSLLLKEVHHRIKNDMNIVRSILATQSESTDDRAVKNALKETQARINVMFNIYNELYRGDDYNFISLKSYVADLVSNINHLYRIIIQADLKLDIDDVSVNRKIIFPVGMIINELVTNSFKYAFADKNCRGGNVIGINISKKEDGTLFVSVFDNGCGFSEDVLSGNCSGFGMQLLKMLSEQLSGSCRFYNNSGAVFEILVPLN